LRIPVLYGEVEKLEESAVTVMFDKVQFSNKSANMDHWQQRFPTHVKDVASVCRQLAEKRMLVRGLGGRGGSFSLEIRFVFSVPCLGVLQGAN
jgi:S-adenosylmethionine synthetase